MKTIKLFVRILMLAVAMYSHAGFAQQSQGKRSMASNASIKKTIKQYYAAYEKMDWGMMEPILADGFTFSSPAGDDHIDIKLYKQRCWPNAEHTKRFDLEKIIIDGDDAFVTYNGWTTGGKLFRNTERFKFKDGKIKENECFFGLGASFPNNTKK
jgi:hypothetical protein